MASFPASAWPDNLVEYIISYKYTQRNYFCLFSKSIRVFRHGRGTLFSPKTNNNSVDLVYEIFLHFDSGKWKLVSKVFKIFARFNVFILLCVFTNTVVADGYTPLDPQLIQTFMQNGSQQFIR